MPKSDRHLKLDDDVRRANAKTCRGCGLKKNLSEYQKDCRYMGGVKSKCRKCLNAYMKERGFAKRYFERNRKAVTAYRKKWLELNRERYNEARRRWVRNNKKKVLAEARKYQTAKRNRKPNWLTKNELRQISRFYEKCPAGFEVDHIIPLQGKTVSGLHVLSNLQYLKVTANRQKSNKR